MGTIASKIFWAGAASAVFMNANGGPLLGTGLTSGHLPANVQQLLGSKQLQAIPHDPLNVLQSLDLLAPKPYDGESVAGRKRRIRPRLGADATAALKKVISDQYDVDEANITNSDNFTDDYGGDSLDFVELVLAIEEEFQIDIPDEDAEKFLTVQDVVNYLDTHL